LGVRRATEIRMGLIVNPIAGMRGRMGLKGTDDDEMLKEAISRGAQPWEPKMELETLAGP